MLAFVADWTLVLLIFFVARELRRVADDNHLGWSPHPDPGRGEPISMFGSPLIHELFSAPQITNFKRQRKWLHFCLYLTVKMISEIFLSICTEIAFDCVFFKFEKYLWKKRSCGELIELELDNPESPIQNRSKLDLLLHFRRVSWNSSKDCGNPTQFRE